MKIRLDEKIEYEEDNGLSDEKLQELLDKQTQELTTFKNDNREI